MIKKSLVYVLTCLLFSPVALSRKASFTETSRTRVAMPSQGLDKIWVDEDGVQHGRGLVIPGEIFGGALGEEGQLLGFEVISLDWNLDLATGNGDFHGRFEREWTVKGVSGTFTGRFQATIMNFNFQGTATAQGSGGFDGMKFKEVFVGIWGGGGTVGTGRILDPSGEF